MSRKALQSWLFRTVEEPLEGIAGGPRRLKVIFLLACILALDAADKATIGAIAAQLKQALRIDNVQVGLLVTVTVLGSAVLTLPFGVLADRFNRRKLLVTGIVLWSLAMIGCGAVNAYWAMLVCRAALGVVMAIASPTIASLIGDYFRPAERGRIYGYILSGEMIGVAVGFLFSGSLAVFSWRAPFLLLAVLGAILACVIAYRLPEPRRGGAGRGAKPAEDGAEVAAPPEHKNGGAGIKEAVRHGDVEPRPDRVLHEDPSRMRVWRAVKYVLSVPTYRTLIIASALGYFYFTGLRTFIVVLMRSRFHLAQAMSSSLVVLIGLGAIVGTLLAGMLADKLVAGGHLKGRMHVGAAAYLVAAIALLPGLLIPQLGYAAPFLFIAAGGLGGAYPAAGAARLDVMHSRLWGRAEGVHSAIVYLVQAVAPPLFGWLSALLGGGGGSGAGPWSQQSGGGMDTTFLVLLVVLASAGVAMLFGARSYPRDVATVVASEQAAANAAAPRPG